MENNRPTNLGKFLETAEGNLMICKEGFFFFMTKDGKHLDKYEKERGKLHIPQKWAEMKNLIGEPKALTEDLSKKATLVIKMKLKPLAERIRRRKAQEARADENNEKIKPAVQRSFAEIRNILEQASKKVA